ncbi:PREDICTED: uncharacterized protein LOC109357809 isoform X2 [Lupinus angustifolius]|uniref:uncharacterized protein LOC109357809 isoform X2 n=1 Tax=Lupinus angustifolius TaxID=3871 RepID=UPI00092FD7BF|nr:PREDICTED: uncharacterized protein LOC109357809 isoform X2 [Lupinus angustifolius]
MLLRSTKKFFQKTLKNFKSFFSPSYYERLPKTPLQNNHFSYSVAATSLEKFYIEQWDSEKEKEGNRRNKNKAALLSSPREQKSEVYNGSSFISFSNAHNKKDQVEKREEFDNQNKKRSLTHQRRLCIVEEKLRELEMLDMSNVDHVLDIEEVLHYYSRLTCPIYLEIVDRFFMQMYSEFFGPVWYATPCSVNSMMKL